MSKKQRQDLEVNGSYQMKQSNQQHDNQATKHAIKTVSISFILMVGIFFGYRFVSGQTLNPFHSVSPQTIQQSSSQSKPKMQSSSSSQHVEKKVDKNAIAISTIEHIYDGMNHLANGYGDTNQVGKPLATYFVDGQKNESYRNSYRWTDNELGNYHTRTVNLTPYNFKLDGDNISYQVKSVYVLARWNHSKATTQWKAKLQMVGDHYKVVKMVDPK